MATAKRQLDFSPTEKDVLVDIADIDYQFDVRASAAVDEQTVKEIVAQGKITQKPLFTQDNVPIDGRTGVEVQKILLATKEEPSVTQVFVDKVGFSWHALTVA